MEYIITCYTCLRRVGPAKVVKAASPDEALALAREHAKKVGAASAKVRQVTR